MYILVIPLAANAAWLGYKNNTMGSIVVIQAIFVVINGQVKTSGLAWKCMNVNLAKWPDLCAAWLCYIYYLKQEQLLLSYCIDCNKMSISFPFRWCNHGCPVDLS